MPSPYVYDSFDRADSSSSLGSADVGGAWTVQSATFGISSLRAYETTGGLGIATIDSGHADADVSVVIAVRLTGGGAGNAGVVFRFTNTSNYWRAFFDGSTGLVFLQKVVGGAASTVFSGGTMGASGGAVLARFNGSTIAVYVNGRLVGTTTDSFNSTATKHGLWINGNTLWRLDDFFAEPAPANPTGSGTASDTFNRADTHQTLGVSSSGHTWEAQSGHFGIVSGRAFAISPAQRGHTIVETGDGDGTITVSIHSSQEDGNAGVVFRWSDASNYWVLFYDGGIPGGGGQFIALRKYVAGTPTDLATFSGALADDDGIGVVLAGSSIEVLQNTTTLGTYTDSFNSTATKHGLWINTESVSVGWKLDNFSTGQVAKWGVGHVLI